VEVRSLFNFSFEITNCDFKFLPLEVNNGNIQKTYMKQLSYGQSIHEILKYCKAEKTTNNYTDLLFDRR
jgi:hypothetical protein